MGLDQGVLGEGRERFDKLHTSARSLGVFRRFALSSDFRAGSVYVHRLAWTLDRVQLGRRCR